MTDPAAWDIKPDPSSLSATASYHGCNAGSTPQKTGDIMFTLSQTQTTSFKFNSATTVSVQFEAGIPAVTGGKIQVGASETVSVGKDYGKSVTLSTNVNAGSLSLKPFSRQEMEYSMKLEQYQIPFTATAHMEDECGGSSAEVIQGSALVRGVANMASATARFEYGPSVPWKCKSPFTMPLSEQYNYKFCPSVASDSCSENIMCDATAIGTNNCGCAGPNPLPCCSTARAHPGCAAYPKDAVMCPNAYGVFDPCCSTPGHSRRLRSLSALFQDNLCSA